MKDFHFGDNEKVAKRSEKYCYLICLVLTIWNCFGYLIFCCFVEDNSKIAAIEIRNHMGDYKIIYQISVIFAMLTLAYIQMIPIYFAFYIVWTAQIHTYRITEYIQKNLCKDYQSFDVINSKEEQDRIYSHLMKITKFHLFLK